MLFKSKTWHNSHEFVRMCLCVKNKLKFGVFMFIVSGRRKSKKRKAEKE